jgi:hypothetical protein
VGGQHHAPGRFTPGKDPVPIVHEAGWAPGPVWTCAKNLALTGIFVFLFVLFALFVRFVSFVFNCPFASYRTACCGFFLYEKSDGFGRERTRDLGFQKPARKPLDHRSR